jgi:Homing endonuclease associated repeat
VSKEEILAAMRECADELERCPTVAELKRMKNIGLRTIRRYFSGYADAVRQAGFDAQGSGYKASLEALFEDWAGIVRKLQKAPSLLEYSQHSRHSVGPLITRFGGWTEVPRGLAQFAREKGMAGGWEDVLEIVEAHENRKRCAAKSSSAGYGRSKKKEAQRLYGQPMTAMGMIHAPTNEMGVLFLFGMVARELGYAVAHFQPEFPDCEALREVSPGRWERRRVELEFESRNFLAHGHDPEGCDAIVCWVHNWPDCPEEIEVVELREVMENRVIR